MKFEELDDVLASIVRTLDGVADSEEIAELNAWIGKSPVNRQYFEQLRNIWDATDGKIDLEKIDVSLAFDKVLTKVPQLSIKKTFWFYWQKAAAVIVFPLLLSGLIWMYLQKGGSLDASDGTVYNEVFTAIGTRSSLILADSSRVWLNSGSSIRYPMKFTGKDRTVYLKGEAYFEVKSDVSRPFTVRTTSLEVLATGTKFSVTEYDSNPGTEVTLISGKLQVNGSDDNPELAETLSPDEHFVFNRETKMKVSSFGDTYKYISWKDGVLMFRDEPFDSVLQKISQFFNVDIELRSDELRSYRYYATFKEESLEEILKLLKISAPINYKEVYREPLPDGTFPKKRVIITLKN